MFIAFELSNGALLEPLTTGFPFHLKFFEKDQDFVIGSDMDEPMALSVPSDGTLRVLLRVIGTGNDPVLQVRDVASTFYMGEGRQERINNQQKAIYLPMGLSTRRKKNGLDWIQCLPFPKTEVSSKNLYRPKNPE